MKTRAAGNLDAEEAALLKAFERRDFRIKAAKLGMPYQTLVASVLHRYLTGRLVATDA